MKTELGYKYNLEIETLTPVSIGNGSTLSPLADYWINGNTACKVNYKKLEEALEAKPEALSDYIAAVNDASSVKKNNFLYHFIKNTLKEDTNNFINETVSVVGQENAIELKTCVQEQGKFLIPGSTIKGAIKSAMLYNWLIQKEHKDELIVLLNNLDFLYKDDSKKYLSKEEKKEKEIEKEKIKTQIDNLIERFLEKMSNSKRMNFSLLKIEDVYCENISPVWIHTLRYPLKYSKERKGEKREKEKEKIPVFLEAIPQDVKSSFNIDFEETAKIKNRSPYLTKYFAENGMNELLKDINRYSAANLEYEMNCVERKIELNSYLKKLEYLKNLVSQAEEGFAYIPLGFGKTNFYQSIGLALYNWINIIKDGEDVLNYAFESYLRLFNIGKKGQEQLPTTRTLIAANQQPLGWIKLTLTIK
ncbi:MAG: type III-A CRISPR-associated RAMP protein Csm5 [Prevotellaceae bacterium]|jgi:CRISPR-associated protein Csm5|nr:type III-A CRISPR-associated RAMP protein Csm5 [Prevotellaceae bacterium]